MNGIQKLFDRVPERDDGEEIPDHFPGKLVAPLAEWRAAKAEYVALVERVEWLEAERNRIAKSIKVVLDDGTAPDNLADHVQLLMIQEYYPMVEKIERLAAVLDGGKGTA